MQRTSWPLVQPPANATHLASGVRSSVAPLPRCPPAHPAVATCACPAPGCNSCSSSHDTTARASGPALSGLHVQERQCGHHFSLRRTNKRSRWRAQARQRRYHPMPTSICHGPFHARGSCWGCTDVHDMTCYMTMLLVYARHSPHAGRGTYWLQVCCVAGFAVQSLM